MKIVAISDTHGMHRELDIPDGDILIHCGDITGHDRIEEIFDFNDWLSELPHKHKIVVAGNHDGCLQKAGFQLSSLYLSEAMYLENSGCSINGLDVWGSPITPRFMDWYFMEDSNKINRYWNKIPKKTDILVTHGPAYGILDVYRGHLGCKELIKRIPKINPQFHIFGHIHDGYGVVKADDTIFVNCAVCNEKYLPVNKPIEILI